MRHHSLFAPRDFDVSPYFQIIKPTIAASFDFNALLWGDTPLVEATQSLEPSKPAVYPG